MRGLLSTPRCCGSDERGVTAIEFAIAAPVLIMLLLGIYDMGHTLYVSALLRGAVQQAARSDTLEVADVAKANAYVEGIVKSVVPQAEVRSKRVSYYDFADIKRAESWNDNNGNGVCDKAESYIDENRNLRWDPDVGVENNGGANDVTLYTVDVIYEPIFINPFVSSSKNLRTLSASAVKKNQPFALQERYGSAARTCS